MGINGKITTLTGVQTGMKLLSVKPVAFAIFDGAADFGVRT